MKDSKTITGGKNPWTKLKKPKLGKLKTGLIFEDKAGNKLYRTLSDKKNIVTYSATNAEGMKLQIIGLGRMLKKAGLGGRKLYVKPRRKF